MSFAAVLSPYAVAAVAAVVIVTVMLTPRDRYMALRMVIYLLFLFVMMQPRYAAGPAKNGLPRIGLFIDVSRSMSLKSRPAAAEKIRESIIDSLSGSAELCLFTFSGTVEQQEQGRLDNGAFKGNITDITPVIRKSGLDAKVIISDGRDNAGGSPDTSGSIHDVPVYCVGIGGSSRAPDLSISSLRAPGFGFRSQPVSLEFTVDNPSGVAGKTYVYLKNGRKVLAARAVDLSQGKEIPVKLEFIPSETGMKNYSLSIDELKGEINRANNIRSFTVKIARQTIRVLYVAGRPSWEYSFFRRLIKSDPQVELVSFLILRNPDNITVVPENELSLIRFPAREMFTERIYDFDLLIYDNFSYRKFFPQSYLTHIKDFVVKGGGFIMMGGEDSFGRGGYVGTPIGEILPVAMSEESLWSEREFAARPGQKAAHPVLNIAEDENMSALIWKDMPRLAGSDPGLKAKEGATVLLEDESGLPIVSVWDIGEGRVMAMNENSTWRWCLKLSGEGKTPYYYNRFWQKVVRYMIKSDDLNNVRVFAGKDKVQAGETQTLNIRVVDRYWQPVNDAEVSASAVLPSGARVPLGRVAPAGEDGWYHISFPVDTAGVYGISAEASSGGRYLGKGSSEFSAEAVDREMSDTSVNAGLLRSIAGMTGGKYFTMDTLDIKEILKGAETSAAKRREVETITWDRLPVYVFMVLIVLLEWYYRRRRGLP